MLYPASTINVSIENLLDPSPANAFINRVVNVMLAKPGRQSLLMPIFQEEPSILILLASPTELENTHQHQNTSVHTPPALS